MTAMNLSIIMLWYWRGKTRALLLKDLIVCFKCVVCCSIINFVAASNSWFFAIEFGLFHIVSLYNDNKVVPLFLHTFWIAVFTTIVIVRESLLQGPITVTLGKQLLCQ